MGSSLKQRRQRWWWWKRILQQQRICACRWFGSLQWGCCCCCCGCGRRRRQGRQRHSWRRRQRWGRPRRPSGSPFVVNRRTTTTHVLCCVLVFLCLIPVQSRFETSKIRYRTDDDALLGCVLGMPEMNKYHACWPETTKGTRRYIRLSIHPSLLKDRHSSLVLCACRLPIDRPLSSFHVPVLSDLGVCLSLCVKVISHSRE